MANNKILSLVSVVFALVFSLPAIGQLNPKKTQDTLVMIAHKWQATQVEMQGQKVKLPPEQRFSMAFNADGTVNIVGDPIWAANSKIEEKPKWQYNNAKRTISTGDTGGDYFTVLKINNDSMVLSIGTGKNKINTYLERIH